MELAYLFRTQESTIPSAVPYLHASSACKIVDRKDALNVGLIWASGNWNPNRSIKLCQLAALAEIPAVRLYSLQQGPALEQMGPVCFPVVPLSHRTREIAAAAAAMRELDLIISVDTMAAHLAGALARPVWTLLPHEADWRWMRNREDSPWYPTMRLFRQRSPGSWGEVVDHVACELTRYAHRRGA